jgi:hypothetical protein
LFGQSFAKQSQEQAEGVCVELAQAGKMCRQPGRQALPGCLNL